MRFASGVWSPASFCSSIDEALPVSQRGNAAAIIALLCACAPQVVSVEQSGNCIGVMTGTTSGMCSESRYRFTVGESLTAVSSDACQFQGWGNDCAATGPCAASAALAPKFAKPRLSLNITVRNVADGTLEVVGAPDCEFGCAANLPYGTQISVRARPSPKHVAVVTGSQCAGKPVCDFVLQSSESIEVSFEPVRDIPVTLEVTGEGSVASADGRISCAAGQTCVASYAIGETLNLTAASVLPNIVNWSIVGCSGVECSALIDGPLHVGVRFVAASLVTIHSDGNPAVSVVDGRGMNLPAQYLVSMAASHKFQIAPGPDDTVKGMDGVSCMGGCRLSSALSHRLHDRPTLSRTCGHSFDGSAPPFHTTRWPFSPSPTRVSSARSATAATPFLVRPRRIQSKGIPQFFRSRAMVACKF